MSPLRIEMPPVPFDWQRILYLCRHSGSAHRETFVAAVCNCVAFLPVSADGADTAALSFKGVSDLPVVFSSVAVSAIVSSPGSLVATMRAVGRDLGRATVKNHGRIVILNRKPRLVLFNLAQNN